MAKVYFTAPNTVQLRKALTCVVTFRSQIINESYESQFFGGKVQS